MNILKPFKNRQKEILRVEKVKVSRAVFESEEIQRADITLMVEGDNILKLEMTPDALHSLITQASATYYALRPALGRGGGMADWRGMDE